MKSERLQKQINAFEALIANHDVIIAKIEAEKKIHKDRLTAWGQEQKIHEREDPTFSREGLIKEYEKLVKAHDNNLIEASRSNSGRIAINKYINETLTEKFLEAQFPKFVKRLRKLGNDPKVWLKHLQQAENIDIKYAQLLRLDGVKAREMVYDAVMNNGYQSEVINLENVNILGLSNLPKVEAKATELIMQRRLEGKHATWDELNALYLDRKNVPLDWDESLFEEYFPTLVSELTKEGVTISRQAIWRRLLGTGSILFVPFNARQMLNVADSTLDQKFRAWKKSLPDGGKNVHIDFYVHENVPPLFVNGDVAAERGANVTADPVRDLMNDFVEKIYLRVIEEDPTDRKPMRENIVLVNMRDPHGGPDRLVLRLLPKDFENPNLDPHNFLLRGQLPEMKKGDAITSRPHNRIPSPELTEYEAANSDKPVIPLRMDPLDMVQPMDGKTTYETMLLKKEEERRKAEETQRQADEQRRLANEERQRKDDEDDRKARERAVEIKAHAIVAAEKKAAQDAIDAAAREEAEATAAEETHRLRIIMDLHNEEVRKWEAEVRRLSGLRMEAWRAHLAQRGTGSKALCKLSALVGRGPDLSHPPDTFQPISYPSKPVLNVGE